MSQETINHLNTQTLIGFVDVRGYAWHYRAEEQGDESNHYPGAIPIEDVHRRLFNWDAVEGSITVAAELADGSIITSVDNAHKAIMRSDNGHVMGIFRPTYLIHQYEDWLLDQVSSILDDTLQIGSAGLLRLGAQAWVSVEVPENIITPEGVEFRPHLLACTSHDGSLATTYQRVVTNVVCDNTMAAALSEGKDQRLKIRHSKYSDIKLQSARDALAIIHDVGETFSAPGCRAMRSTSLTR